MKIIAKKLSLFFILLALTQVKAEIYNFETKKDSLLTNRFNPKNVVKNNPEITVETIYQNYLKFIDPKGIIPEITSITETISTLVSIKGLNKDSSGSMIYFRSKNGKSVMINKADKFAMKVVFDGEGGYTEHNGKKTPIDKNTINIYKENSGLHLNTPPPSNANVKQVVIEGIDVYEVNYITNLNGSETKIYEYYDINDYKKISYKTISTTNKIVVEMTLFFKEYTTFNELVLPKQTRVSMKSTYSESTTKMTYNYAFNESFEQYANQSIESAASSLASTISFLESSSDMTSNTTTTVSDSEQIAKSLASIDNLSDSDVFSNLNTREQAYQLVLKKKSELGTNSPESFSENNMETVKSTGTTERINKMDAGVAGKLKYRRSSLYTLMLDDNTREHYNVIKDAFGNTEISEKFNNHNIGPYLIPANGSGGEKDQTQLIEDYLNNTGVAKNIVAKWFNRDEKGVFNMNLIAERGQYNASEIDLKIAQSSIRGKALLSDAGRELIGNTFIIVYDYKYTNKKEQAKKRGGFLNKLSSVASFVPGAENISTISSVTKLASDVVGKGYFVRTSCYLYRLEWNDEIAQEFYENLWNDQDSYDETKKEAFDRSNLFKLKAVGSEVSRNNLQSTIFSSKSNEQLIEIATIKAVDKNIGKLQKTYEEFRVKTPLLSIDPIAAKIGIKEDIEKNDKFEVLEQVLNEDGTTNYERVGILKVDGSNIWDNTYLSEETSQDQDLKFTIFKGNSKNLAPGMLIRQIN